MDEPATTKKEQPTPPRGSLAELFDTWPDPIACISGEGAALYVNPALAKLLGAETAGELIGRSADWISSAEGAALFLIRRNGTRVPVETESRPLESAGAGARWIRFRQKGTQSLAAGDAEGSFTIDNLVSRVGHELANLLTPLLGYLELARMDPSGSGLADVADPLWQISRRMHVQIQNLLMIKERPEPHLKPTSIVEILQRAVVGAQETGLLASHTVQWAPPAGSKEWKTPAEPDLLVQMFVNLLLNAAESMRSPGVIAVDLTRSDRGFTVRIIDTGVGVAPEAAARIFQPLFSAKATGRGIGLGLPVCRRIVQRHGGNLRLEPHEPAGTTTIVELADGSPANFTR